MAAKVRLEGDDLFVEGPYYLDVLERLHAAFEPRTYLEVGVFAGDTLRLARCPSLGVDPTDHVQPGVLADDAPVRRFTLTSDAFFEAHDPRKLLGRRVDLAFLDGMHHFDFLLRDFINAERCCLPGSMIVMHDCLPGDAWMTRPWERVMETAPTRFPGDWTGDVWKIVPVLRALRPDLRVTVLDAAATGLTVVRGLNPESRVLADRLDALVAEWGPVQLADYGMARMLADMDPQSSEHWLARVRSVRLSSRLKRKGRSAAIRAKALISGRPQPAFSSPA